MTAIPNPAKPINLTERMPRAALAFRGYNTTNLGRTAELLAVPAYETILRQQLLEAQSVCSEVLDRPVDLIARIREGRETELHSYAEAVAMIFAVELAQIEILNQCHSIDVSRAKMSIGYSLGELIALVASGRLPSAEALRVPLAMSTDCAALAEGVRMGVLFSRGPAIKESLVHQLCADITSLGNGTVAVSAILSPNTFLVLGQNETLTVFKKRLKQTFPSPVHLRLNDSQWPPLHTPIVRQRFVTDRAAVMMETLCQLPTPAGPPVFSLVTGSFYDDQPPREVLRQWVDQPQRLWDGVCAVLAADVKTLIHVGPAPNVIPATFKRLSDNVLLQTAGGSLTGWGMRAVREIADRTWLANLLPKSAMLLRAPGVQPIILEDWLIDNAPS